MTMHVILGDGEMKPKELKTVLDELWEVAEKEDNEFWFLLQGKSAPTDTDQEIVGWLNENDIFYTVVTDDAKAMWDGYNPAQTFKVKSMTSGLVALLDKEPGDGEIVDLLALFVSDDPTAEEDRWLSELLVECVQAGHGQVRALNDGLVELDFDQVEEPEEEETEETEETESPKSSKKAPAKKAAAKKPAKDPEPETLMKVLGTPTRDELEDMTLDEIKEVAAERGIELPPRTRATTYIDHILGEADKTPAAEVEQPSEVEGIDIDHIVDVVTERVLARIGEMLHPGV